MDFLRMAQARGRYLGMDLELIISRRGQGRCSRCSRRSTSSARCTTRSRARRPVRASPTPTRSAPAWPAPRSYQQHVGRRASASDADGTWDVLTESGDTIHAEHVVNAGGLWAREVGRMVGLELPVLAMEHHYLVTEDMPEVAAHVAARPASEMPMALDFAGEIYIRQERAGMLLGTYEQACVPWSPKETPWDFGSQLLKPDLDRIAPELEVAFEHFPAMAHDRHQAGRQRPVHVLARRQPARRPDPRPARLLGRLRGDGRPVAGRRRRPGARELDDRRRPRRLRDGHLGAWTSPATATTPRSPTPTRRSGRTTARRFRITFPNEELPAARPLLTTPIYDRLTAAQRGLGRVVRARARAVVPGARAWSRSRTSRSAARTRGTRSPPSVAAVRERVGLTEISNFAKYRVTGAGRRGLAVGPAHEPDAGDGPDHPHGDAQRRRAASSGEFTVARADRGGRVLPVRVAGGRGPPLALVPRPPAGRRLGPVRGARPGAGRPVGRRARASGTSCRRSTDLDLVDRGLPVHGLPAGRPRDDPGPRRPDQLHRRPRLRAVGRAGVPARAVRPADGRRASRTACACSGCAP